MVFTSNLSTPWSRARAGGFTLILDIEVIHTLPSQVVHLKQLSYNFKKFYGSTLYFNVT